MYYDSPEDAIQDDFDRVVFGEHPLGKNILGSRDSIRAFGQKDFRQFLAENMNTEKLVFCCVGNVDQKKVVKLAEKYLAKVPTLQGAGHRLPFQTYIPHQETTRRSLTQAQCAIGRTAFSVHDERSLPFFMLTNLLGGAGMNTRLNMALREKHGLVYSVDADYQSYTDTGFFAIYFGTEPGQLKRAVRYVMRELKMLREKPLGTGQLHRAKEQLMGQLAMSSENNQGLMLAIGRSLLENRDLESLDTIYQKISAITASDLQGVAQEMFQEDDLSTLTYVPEVDVG